MQKQNLLSTAIILSLSGSSAWAANANVPHQFQSGTKALASEVNENFDAIKSAVDDNNSRIGAVENQLSNMGSDTGCTGIDENDVMVKVGNLCVDKYEASVWNDQGGSAAGGTQLTDDGVADPDTANDYNCSGTGSDCNNLYARSEAGVTPSTRITWFQAQRACANSGKRLLTNAEWQMAVSGTPDPAAGGGADGSACNTGGGAPSAAGDRGSCTSAFGANDMIGNAWEWTADWMQGVQTGSVGDPDPVGDDGNQPGTYGDDTAQNIDPGKVGSGGTLFPGAIIRGGSFLGDSDSGAYALAAQYQPSVVRSVIGFRCAR